VPGFVRGSALMHQGRPLSQLLRAQGLCEVTVLVPEGHVEDIRLFAQELRVRQRAGPAETPLRWLALSPSAELMISPDCSARCSVRGRVRTAFVGPSRCWDSWTRLPKGGLRPD